MRCLISFVSAALLVLGCETPTLSFPDDAGDAATSRDATRDTGSDTGSDAQGDTGPHQCGTTTVASCADCATGHVLCTDNNRNECVNDCFVCNTTLVPCVYCKADSLGSYYATCVQPDQLGSVQCGDVDRCACAGGLPSGCPAFNGSEQACEDVGGVKSCRTCGEPGSLGVLCAKSPTRNGNCKRMGTLVSCN